MRLPRTPQLFEGLKLKEFWKNREKDLNRYLRLKLEKGSLIQKSFFLQPLIKISTGISLFLNG